MHTERYNQQWYIYNGTLLHWDECIPPLHMNSPIECTPIECYGWLNAISSILHSHAELWHHRHGCLLRRAVPSPPSYPHKLLPYL